MPKKRLLVFLSHASEDKQTIRELCQRLKDDGFDPWLDEDRILPGHDWQLEIELALRKSDAILVNFSKNSLAKEGYIQREYKKALDYRKEKPEGTIFVIPVRLDNCEIPFFLKDIQCVDFPSGYERLLMSLNIRAGKSTSTRKSRKIQVTDQSIVKADRGKEDTKQVQIVLEGNFEEFNETSQEDLVSVLSSMLRIDAESIRILQVYSGSIVVVAAIPNIAADRLVEFAAKKDLRLIAKGVLSIKVDGQQIVMLSDTQLPSVDKTVLADILNRMDAVIEHSDQIIKERMPLLFITLAESLANEMAITVLKPAILEWRDGNIKTLNGLKPETKKRIDTYLSSVDTQGMIEDIVFQWFSNISRDVLESIKMVYIEFSLDFGSQWFLGRVVAPLNQTLDSSFLRMEFDDRVAVGTIVGIVQSVSMLALGSPPTMLVMVVLFLITAILSIFGRKFYVTDKITGGFEKWALDTNLSRLLRRYLLSDEQLDKVLQSSRPKMQEELERTLRQNMNSEVELQTAKIIHEFVSLQKEKVVSFYGKNN